MDHGDVFQLAAARDQGVVADVVVRGVIHRGLEQSQALLARCAVPERRPVDGCLLGALLGILWDVTDAADAADAVLTGLHTPHIRNALYG